MPAYNFKTQFIEKILSGEKLQTIRRRRRKCRLKVGDEMYLYSRMRTKQCEFIACAKCVKIEPVIIYSKLQKIEVLTGDDTYSPLSISAIATLARKDGFETIDEFFAFFSHTYADEVLYDFEILYWDYKTLRKIHEVKHASAN